MKKKKLENLKKICYYIFIVIGVSEVRKMRLKKIKIEDIADAFLRIVDRDSGSTITPLKLQKILYYAQGYYLAMNDKPLFDDDFQAWAHGPVNPKIYNEYKSYGYSLIDYPKGEAANIKENILEFLYTIWNTFGIYDGKYLEEMTHNETPWIEARKNAKPGEKCTNVIDKESMKKFFKLKLNE